MLLLVDNGIQKYTLGVFLMLCFLGVDEDLGVGEGLRLGEYSVVMGEFAVELGQNLLLLWTLNYLIYFLSVLGASLEGFKHIFFLPQPFFYFLSVLLNVLESLEFLLVVENNLFDEKSLRKICLAVGSLSD